MRAAALLVLALVAAGAEAAGYVTQCSVRAEEALRRINAARAAGQRCGWRRMPPAPPLRWEGRLQAIAAAHSRDMARRNYFDHRSPEGREVAHRATAGHYKFRLVGENLAGGDRDVTGAVRGWLESPSHCENLMNPKFAEVAVACVGRKGSQWGTYWTMVLGRR
ncbi:MAG TPA: CAP domain-containing protein [Ramlibacter sp.]